MIYLWCRRCGIPCESGGGGEDPSSALGLELPLRDFRNPREERETSRAYGKQLVTLDLWHMSVKLRPAIHPLDLYSTRNGNFLQRSAFVAQGHDVTTLQYMQTGRLERWRERARIMCNVSPVLSLRSSTARNLAGGPLRSLSLLCSSITLLISIPGATSCVDEAPGC